MSEFLNFDLLPVDNKRLANLCGQFNEHLQQMEEYFDVDIDCNGNRFHISGDVKRSKAAMQLIKNYTAWPMSKCWFPPLYNSI